MDKAVNTWRTTAATLATATKASSPPSALVSGRSLQSSKYLKYLIVDLVKDATKATKVSDLVNVLSNESEKGKDLVNICTQQNYKVRNYKVDGLKINNRYLCWHTKVECKQNDLCPSSGKFNLKVKGKLFIRKLKRLICACIFD